MNQPERSTVLVVDDTPANLLLMSALLKSRYEVKVANSGAKALQIVSAGPLPDLILLDVMMPLMDGYEVIRVLKENPATAGVPVLFLTALADHGSEEKGLKLGAVDYITKPISAPIVLARLATHLALAQARQFLVDQNAYLESEVTRRVTELARIQDVFGKVVDPRIRDHLLQRGNSMGGDITEGAVMFCDIRDFTAYSESRDPRLVIEFLNRFFSEAAGCVEREGGFVNKYIGDSFMAVFGTPFPLEDFRSAAIRAALAVREVVKRINAEHPEEQPFRVGMGVHAGPMVAGIVGSQSRMEFTTIGDTVNTASRLETLTKEYGVDILLSAAVLERLKVPVAARPLGTAALRGKLQTLEVFAL